MKKFIITLVMMILISSQSSAEVGFRGRPIINNLMIPTGYTLNQGEFMLGLGSIGFGLSDNIQVGTNILLFLFQVYNVNGKVSLLKTEISAFSLGCEYAYANWNMDEGKGEGDFTMVSPYVAFTTQLDEKVKLHFRGKYALFSSNADVNDVEPSSTTQGTTLSTGIEYSLSHKTKFLTDAGYDFTFDGFRIGGGFLFGWERFRLKLGVNLFSVGTSTFTFPVIGFRWRFMG
jgi:hypothetical protein